MAKDFFVITHSPQKPNNSLRVALGFEGATLGEVGCYWVFGKRP